ncbi:hypothetical protein NM688_g6406 [Phlebia brevispora]|uniref:Uncharacterized protein n=1 Tax=Phlebia brevispora TaxID=194682 RepID=A0ACC1SGD5_9APHY|nr:hypothetical protein NM688_g6406 [Phlebia brevispora]
MPVATSNYSYSRLSYISTVPSSPDRDRKKSGKKENQFLLREGSRLHAYDRDKAPYPFSYDRDLLELSCIDHALIYRLKQSVTVINFKELPKRCLDLGTGLGDWVIDAAKLWEDCTFVGYDLVNVQMPLSALDPSISSRIQWVHGNFLRQKLPFEDDEFDHVHIQGLAFAIFTAALEQWPSFFEEVHRVLRPGGTVEIIEEDAIFPILPKWFTTPLHAPVPYDTSEENVETGEIQPTQQRSHQSPPSTDHLPHAHALLEELFFAVFHNRFLNPIPSSMLPGYFSAFFSHVLSPPVIKFPMPPLAPMRPLPPPSRAMEPSPSLSGSSVGSDSPRSSASESIADSAGVPLDSPSMERSRSNSSSTSVDSQDSSKSQFVAYHHEEGTRIGGSTAVELFPLCDTEVLNSYSLYMQLRRAVVLILGLKEAMWDELKLKIERDRNSLKIYGWEEADFEEEGLTTRDRGPSRQKFDAMVQQ